MATRADFRMMVRRKLEDTAGSPLWDDTMLNDVLSNAVAHYGVRFPAEKVVSVAVSAEDRSVPVVVSPGVIRIVKVRDPNGDTVEQLRSGSANGIGVAQAWMWWNDELVLVNGAIGGDWQIDYLANRALPDDDVTPVDVKPDGREIVVLLAAADALLRRSVEQGKRGLERAGLALANVAEMHGREADRLMSARRRRVVGGWSRPG